MNYYCTEIVRIDGPIKLMLLCEAETRSSRGSFPIFPNSRETSSSNNEIFFRNFSYHGGNHIQQKLVVKF